MDRVMFHLGRVTHMATSCVSCGMCEDVCPVDIKVSQFFKYMGANIQKIFDYVPGINREVTLPLLTFREEEFREAED
jgi:formate dehydrogenase subunit beta